MRARRAAGERAAMRTKTRLEQTAAPQDAAPAADYERIVLVTRKTRLQGLIERFNTPGQAKFYVEHAGADYSDYEAEHEAYVAALRRVKAGLEGLAKLHQIEREFLPNYLFTDKQVVVAVGQDGLVVNAAKYVHGQPIVGINPDAGRFDGVLLPYRPEHAAAAVRQVLRGRARVRRVTMAQATLADGQTLLAFNDLFVGVRSHVSARYVIDHAGRKESHSSSGIIVSTGAGSSGWLSSLYNMARGMAPLLGGDPQEAGAGADSRFAWEAERLVFVVREPFLSRSSQAGLVAGEITRDKPLRLESRTPEGGVIFSDGVETDYLNFNAGALATLHIAARKASLVVP